MENKAIKTNVKSIDGESLTFIKLFERQALAGNNSYTIELKQGIFITEIQAGFSKEKALNVFNVIIDKDIDIYIDRLSSVKDNTCGNCNAKNVILISFDNNMTLCENCASEYGLE